ncbi:membrane protein insertase YidC [Candidatus Uhrbacteria bacterium]|nr:membrane protein insertase YidC [Candidatus Uhrbacteria bacterium]
MFQTYLAEPMYNLLVWLYNVIPLHDIGIAIIVLTLIIKGVLWPLTGKALKSQRMLQALQPKIDALRKECGQDKERLAAGMMKLYKEEKVNPASSCLPLLIQLPILIALYRVLLVGLNNGDTYQLYDFVADPGTINEISLGFINLARANIVLALLAGASQYVQAKMLQIRRPPAIVRGTEAAKDEDLAASMNKSMLYIMPVMTVVIGASLPGGLALYWLVVTLLSILQQYLVFRSLPHAAPAQSTS